MISVAAGNLALKFMALGSVYLGGGIALKIVAKFFRRAFTDKGQVAQLLNTISVYVILDPKAGLWGVAGYTILKAYSFRFSSKINLIFEESRWQLGVATP